MCPECSAARIANHPNGALVMSHAADCSLGRAWDSVVEADARRTDETRTLTRAPAAVEVDLAVALGLGPPTAVEVTRLTESAAVVQRAYVVEA